MFFFSLSASFQVDWHFLARFIFLLLSLRSFSLIENSSKKCFCIFVGSWLVTHFQSCFFFFDYFSPEIITREIQDEIMFARDENLSLHEIYRNHFSSIDLFCGGWKLFLFVAFDPATRDIQRNRLQKYGNRLYCVIKIMLRNLGRLLKFLWEIFGFHWNWQSFWRSF